MVHRPRLVASSVLAIMALVLAVLGGVPAARAADTPLPTSVTLAGSLQSEIGCAADWTPDCAVSPLARVGESSV